MFHVSSSFNFSRYKMIRISCLVFLLLVFLCPSFLTNTGHLVAAKGNDYVRDACSVTRYPDLCIHSLASFSSTARRSPSRWARAGVSVTISEVKNVQSRLAKLKRYRRLRGRNRDALLDCIESFADALDELHRSLGVLRRLSRSTFGNQMDDLNTWISAALTDEDTCLDGFEGQKERQIKLLQDQVLNVSYITSNALALVNKLATTGLDSINDPYKF
ncbi:pectinesterase inhibitor 6-like [Prosopis cineraria]|uniref:pectinesterase inhibitor 6-like n=1 Tax=Prosopis cineraria TaxID=364024 RepID=UPI00240FDFEE|nr:pectinesterase inhibitor 6-like [Prosopis cineraria]